MSKLEADVIGGFEYANPNCEGCGKPLTVENAWMTDGCPCNSVLGINNKNEARWRLLMQLQQQQAQLIERLQGEVERLRAESDYTPQDKWDALVALKNDLAKQVDLQRAEIERLQGEIQAIIAPQDVGGGLRALLVAKDSELDRLQSEVDTYRNAWNRSDAQLAEQRAEIERLEANWQMTRSANVEVSRKLADQRAIIDGLVKTLDHLANAPLAAAEKRK